MVPRSMMAGFDAARIGAASAAFATRDNRAMAAVATIGIAAAGAALAAITLFTGMREAAPVAGGLACAAAAGLLFMRAGRFSTLVPPAVHLTGAASAAIVAPDHPFVAVAAFAGLMALWAFVSRAERAREDAPDAIDMAPAPPVPAAFLLTPAGNVSQVNDCAAIPALSAGLPLASLVHVNDRIGWMQALAGAASGSPVSVSARIDRAAIGKAQDFRVARFDLEPAASGLIAVRMAGEASEQEPVAATAAAAPAPNTAAQQYLAMASHELRTPLNAIIGFSDILRSDLIAVMPEARKREYVDLIHNAGTHLLSIVNTILDVSKIQAGHYAVNRESFDLPATVREAVAMVATRAAAKNIHLNVRLDADMDAAVADRRAVKQILINLLSNAVKFTDERGCVTIDAGVRNGVMVIDVADTGIGMSADELETIGEPFTQVDNSYTRQCEGTGLGLALVKGLVRLHGGRFEITSEPAVGTCVHIAIPCQDEAQSVLAPPAGTHGTNPVRGDDHESLRFG